MKKSIIPFLSGLATGIITAIGGLVVASTIMDERIEEKNNDMLFTTLEKLSILFDKSEFDASKINSERNKYIEKVIDANKKFSHIDKNIVYNINSILELGERMELDITEILNNVDTYIVSLCLLDDSIKIKTNEFDSVDDDTTKV